MWAPQPDTPAQTQATGPRRDPTKVSMFNPYEDGDIVTIDGQDWTVNAYEQGGCCHWWVTSGEPATDVVMAPGNVGWSTANGAHASFGECVSASQSLAPVEFVHAGGPIGLRLQDSNFPDNTAGEGGVNPRWRLSTACD